MRRFVLGWKTLGHERALRARIVNYADDFVICCRGTANEAMQAMRKMMSRLKLTVNETKTHVCYVPDESFDFLGYTFGRMYAPRTGQPYIGARPSRKKVAGLRQAISEQTSARWEWADSEEIVGRLNRMLRGWANYFSYGSVRRAHRAVDYHTRERLREWLCRKHKIDGRGTARFPLQYGYKELGLIELRVQRRTLPRAKA